MSISGRIAAVVRTASRGATTALLPQVCFLCGDPDAGDTLCLACEDSLPLLPTLRCPICALPTPGGEICGGCMKQPPHFDATVAHFRYAFPLDKLVQALKYQHRLALAGLFAASLRSDAVPDGDAVLPVPLSPLRLRERGFNQAVEIARPLARHLRLPLWLDACRRPQEMPPQASLPWQVRRRNVRGVFECTADLTGKSIIVIDDVMTTGATLDELARTLKKHGARRVSNWVVARTLKD